MARWKCEKCGYVGDEDTFGWDESDDDWWRTCPKCESSLIDYDYEETKMDNLTMPELPPPNQLITDLAKETNEKFLEICRTTGRNPDDWMPLCELKHSEDLNSLTIKFSLRRREPWEYPTPPCEPRSKAPSQ